MVVLKLLCLGQIYGQENPSSAPRNQIDFQHDNDFVLLTDRYYSSGLYLTYRRSLEVGLFTLNEEQLDFQLQYLAFTPSDVETFDFNKFDRPYAGFLGVQTSWSLAREESRYKIDLLLGVTGPISSAGQFQQWYHENIVLFKTPSWSTEIENSFHANINAHYAKEWQLTPNPFSITLAATPSIAIGTKDVYAQPEISVYLGRKNAIQHSIAYHRINTLEREIFVAFNLGYRIVGHNALLQGNLFGDSSLFTLQPKRTVLHLGVALRHRSEKNYYTLGYRYIGNEATTADDHQYLTLSYGRSF
ncbi:MAG: lipid A deacylase LpxR family protein [Bacteroidetes bacterium]|nr:lipid A deacylase LpxR family protein [Bacteroidota bacterium]